jgi:hypothetical protein
LYRLHAWYRLPRSSCGDGGEQRASSRPVPDVPQRREVVLVDASVQRFEREPQAHGGFGEVTVVDGVEPRGDVVPLALATLVPRRAERVVGVRPHEVHDVSGLVVDTTT